jgi:hypothetical protein
MNVNPGWRQPERPFRLNSRLFHQSAAFPDDPAKTLERKGKEHIMQVFKKFVSAGLVALSIAGALAATAPAAQARDRHYHHDNILPGVAAGLAGGIIGGAIIAGSQRPVYVEPEYDYAPPPPPVYHRTYYRAQYAPRCHYEWVENEWGEAYRASVCR